VTEGIRTVTEGVHDITTGGRIDPEPPATEDDTDLVFDPEQYQHDTTTP
jgi:hypothetical protein